MALQWPPHSSHKVSYAGLPSLENASGLATGLNFKVEPNSDEAVVQIPFTLQGGSRHAEGTVHLILTWESETGQKNKPCKRSSVPLE